MFKKVNTNSSFLKIISKGCVFSVLLFVLILSVVHLVNMLMPIRLNYLRFEILLASIFFLMAVLLVYISHIITKRNYTKVLKLRFTEVFDFLGEEISIPDSKTLTFTYLNKNFLKNSQFSEEELIGECIDKTNPNCQIVKMKEFIKPLIVGEKDSLEYETIRQRKDGTNYPIRTVLKYFSDSNTLIAFSQDVTQDKAVEELKQKFISLLNHKIRTKLTSIAGSLKIITNGLVGEIPLRMKEMISMANENAQELSNEIDKLLDIDNYSNDV